MAIKKDLTILNQGVEVWNAWREEHPLLRPDLEDADLSGANLGHALLYDVNLARASLESADLNTADLDGACLVDANLNNANLARATFRKAELLRTSLQRANLFRAGLARSMLDNADLEGANLSDATLVWASLVGANLKEANLEKVNLRETVLADVDLSTTKGLSSCKHLGPCTVDHRTIEKSKNVPLEFWRGCGLPDALIDYTSSLTSSVIRFYSCFISYSSKDQEFAERIHADLHNNGVRCWFAPHDLPIGEKILDGIDQAIRMRDKVVLILSEEAIASDWVEDEVTMAFEEERLRKDAMLFPIRLDDAVMESSEAWAGKLRARNIGNFTNWKDNDAYKATFARVLRDLKVNR